MGITPADARTLTLGEYGALLFHHNLRVDPDGTNAPPEPVSIEDMAAMDQHFAARFGETMQ